MKRFSVFMVILALVTIGLPVPIARAEEATTQLIISHVKLNDKTDGNEGVVQSVGVQNISADKIDLTGWTLEYAKPAFDSAKCDVADWGKAASGTEGYSFSLTGEILAGQTLAFSSFTDVNKTTEGAFRLMSPEVQGVRVQHDLVGWGSDDAQAKCFETAQAEKPGDNNLLTRCVDETGMFRDTNDNSEDFIVMNAAGYAPPQCAIPGAVCESVAITEVLPNPASSDDGHEFIEIHNPTEDVIDLSGCGLASDDGQEFMFAPGAELSPGEYRAFYDDVSGIGLTNSKNIGLMIISADEEFLQATYPADLKDDVSWALIDGAWQKTDNPTPGAPNQPMTPEEAEPPEDEGLGPCPPGKFRNPLTNRCKSITLASAALTPCKSGQVRNPETNRCRSVATASSARTPCKPGQERNPETNRCRKVASATDLKPCDEGEERNPETNRCRKVAAVLSGADPDDKKDDEEGSVNYGILGLVGASAVGYGAYEYRNDFRNKFAILKSRFFPDKSGE